MIEFSCKEISKKILKYYDHYFRYFKVMENISKMLCDFLKYLMAGDCFFMAGYSFWILPSQLGTVSCLKPFMKPLLNVMWKTEWQCQMSMTKYSKYGGGLWSAKWMRWAMVDERNEMDHSRWAELDGLWYVNTTKM